MAMPMPPYEKISMILIQQISSRKVQNRPAVWSLYSLVWDVLMARRQPVAARRSRRLRPLATSVPAADDNLLLPWVWDSP
jgi:hypothetical protein